MQKLQKNQKGFTIIEVLIVLAIAGLIMLVVFLAVPALQRNSRNSQRNNDASRVSAAVVECLANRNGDANGCDTAGELNIGTLSQLTTVNVSDTNAVPASSTTAVGVWHSRVCRDDGSGVDTAATVPSRSFVVLFTIEPNTTRCISA